MNDDTFGLIVAMIIVFGLFTIVIFVDEDYKVDVLMLGDEVRTSDYYNECFNESFEGRIIGSQTHRYTVRDMEGNERTFEKKWLIKTGEDCYECIIFDI